VGQDALVLLVVTASMPATGSASVAAGILSRFSAGTYGDAERERAGKCHTAAQRGNEPVPSPLLNTEACGQFGSCNCARPRQAPIATA
jgi:hypothetical protein